MSPSPRLNFRITLHTSPPTAGPDLPSQPPQFQLPCLAHAPQVLPIIPKVNSHPFPSPSHRQHRRAAPRVCPRKSNENPPIFLVSAAACQMGGAPSPPRPRRTNATGHCAWTGQEAGGREREGGRQNPTGKPHTQKHARGRGRWARAAGLHAEGAVT